MQAPSDVELADRLSRRRAQLLPLLGILFIAGQPLFFANQRGSGAQLATILWLAWAMALLGALPFMGGRAHGAAVRALVEDEVSRANRLRAYATAFWAAAFATVSLYAYSLIDNVKGREALHLVLTVAVAAALIRFGTLERRALADG